MQHASHEAPEAQLDGPPPQREGKIDGPTAGPAAHSADRARAWAKRALLTLAVGLLSAWLFGAWLFLRADGHMFWQLPRREEHPIGEHNLALYVHGPRVRASSSVRDVENPLHPAFVLDGVTTPSGHERWRSDPKDRHPWLEVSWREGRRLSRVVLRHDGPVSAHRVSCLTAPGASPRVLSVAADGAAEAQHALTCAAARGVRVDWQPATDGISVGLLEIEAWGQ
ncbi:MAG TPA: hypothetical protein VFZ61_06965 [Polyangiales bacterium]